ncbi:hypothetical protein PMKS-003731 [Pichia membranifaciens]|uniref:MutL C-terminal dimerisation domain-containing protein n=1 Tax=Pichia membranifaciens TaxID=4926 RepID=A0A1Q2YL05_9ASCO|nr:hypothetical protein PMKS-003731 [Pichia membranifaciens]
MALRRISKEDVHNITSGQVITDLNNIVKELVENSIDANSTSINVTFRKFGLDGLEVSDNGDGIKAEDFQNLCLKNYTSKLENFEKLIDVKTLGFRGEALNSICNVSQVSILTAAASKAPKGSELFFDREGDLVEQKIINQSKGTTIRVNDIFRTLPVRRLHLEKHSRKEFQKCLQTLMSYLLILTNIRVIVYNVDGSGKKKIVMKTAGNSLIKDNIVNVYGATGLQGLEEVNLEIDLDEKYSIKINGMLSNSSIGSGRLSKDRQYLYINQRPVEFKKIIKLVNDVYKKFNYLQYPMILLNLEIHEHLIDINVTPDKKTILLSNKYEIILMGKLETYLEDHWDNEGSYNIPVNESYQEKIQERNSSTMQPKLESFALFQDSASVQDSLDDIQVELMGEKAVQNSKVIVDINFTTASKIDDTVPSGQDYCGTGNDHDEDVVGDGDGESVDADEADNELLYQLEDTASSEPLQFSICNSVATSDRNKLEKNTIKSNMANSIDMNRFSPERASSSCCDSCHSVNPDHPKYSINSDKEYIEANPHNSGQAIAEGEGIDPQKEEENEQVSFVNQKVRVSDDSLISKNLKRRRTSGRLTLKSSLEASDISDRNLSEKILGLSIHKNDFNTMEIVGQFNKGFIIVYKRDTDDILIIDQHASDEKFNFEKLIEGTVFENQPLVVPQKMDLNTIERLTILDNLKIFEKNGFKFKTCVVGDKEEAEAENFKREELYLTALPYSKNTIFDLKDLNELVQLVEDEGASTLTIPRPSKVRSMFAMRACRSSIMIGSSLSRLKMENIVQNLSALDKPWNCPHGRPTMRHLVKIDQWRSFTDDYQLN